MLSEHCEELLRRFDSSIEQPFRHEAHEQRARPRLTIHRALRVELDVSEAGVAGQADEPFAMRIDRVDVQPVVERGSRLEREADALEVEGDQRAGLSQT